MNERIVRKINGKLMLVPVVDELPDGMYKRITSNREFAVYYSMGTCEFFAMRIRA